MRNFVMVMAVCMGTGAAAQTPDVLEAVYTCERGVTVPVTYIAVDGYDPMAVIFVEGRQFAMRRFVSASGEKYASLDEQAGYRWWAQGENASLSYQAADDSAEEVDLLTACVINGAG